MKNLLFIAILFLAGWAGYSFFAAYLDRVNFQNEMDSLLQTPRELSENTLPGMIENKAAERNIDVNPEDIDVRIGPAGRSSQLSERFEKKGVEAETRVLDLHFEYSQTVMGLTRTYSFDRERTFTYRISPYSKNSQDVEKAFR
jgi:hypothetical protein